MNQRQTKFRAIALLLFCVGVCSVAHSEQLPIRIFTSADGLGSSFVDCLLRDSRGFMWFCTRDGLSRFDGSHFVTYRVGDKNSPPGVENIYESHDGTYWVTTPAGLHRFRGDALSRPDPNNNGKSFLNVEFVSPRRGLMYEDSKGQLWYVGGVFARVSERDGKVVWDEIKLNLPPRPELELAYHDISEGPDGSLWLISNRGLIRYLRDGRTILYDHPSVLRQGSVAMTVQQNGNVWAAWGKDMFVIKPEPLDQVPFTNEVQVRSLEKIPSLEIDPGVYPKFPDAVGPVRLTRKSLNPLTMSLGRTADGHIWIVGNNEVIEFDGKRFKVYSSEQGLPLGMSDLTDDSAGNLWIGGRNGLVRLDRKGLTSFGPSDGLASSAMFAVGESRDGRVYVANGDYYLSTYDGHHFNSVRPNLDPDSRPLWTSRYAYLSSSNEWWILTNAKLYRFAANNLRTPIKTYTARDGFKENQMFQIFEDSRGNIWVSQQPDKAADSGLYILRKGAQEFVQLSSSDGFPASHSASCFVEDRQQNLWLGFYEGGLARYRNGKFQVFDNSDGLPGSLISDLLIDRAGRLWVGTILSGLRRVDDPSADKPVFTNFTTDDGLSSNNVRTLVDDEFGNIYAGGARGIDKISITTQLVKHYSINDGLAGDFVVDSHRDHTGALWFATTGGLSRLIPFPDETAPRPKVLVGGLRIAGEQQPVAELGDFEIKREDLTHTRNSFQIDFFGLSFRPGETLRYQYMLEGADKDWSAPTESRTVSLANLRPGTYRFLVRAVNMDGLTSERPASVSFRILPPIWLRWWFLVLVLFLLLLIGYLFYRYRLGHLRTVNAALRDAHLADEKLRKSQEERLVELERVRKRIATDLHDDVGASLTRISLLSEVTQLQGQQVQTPSGGSLSVIAGLSRELVDSMSDIVWSINPEKDSLADLTQRMRHFASDVFSARNIDFRFDFPASEKDLKVSATFRREVFLIFKEAVNNAVKHSGCTEAEIEFRLDHEGVLLRVSDNGAGFDVRSESNGHGLNSMRSRIESFSGKMKVESGRGTTLTFTIPPNAYINMR